MFYSFELKRALLADGEAFDDNMSHTSSTLNKLYILYICSYFTE